MAMTSILMLNLPDGKALVLWWSPREMYNGSVSTAGDMLEHHNFWTIHTCMGPNCQAPKIAGWTQKWWPALYRSGTRMKLLLWAFDHEPSWTHHPNPWRIIFFPSPISRQYTQVSENISSIWSANFWWYSYFNPRIHLPFSQKSWYIPRETP